MWNSGSAKAWSPRPKPHASRALLQAVLRPESYWILDSRRLTLSQITLYLGGWFALIALGIGMLLTSDIGDMSDAFAAWPAVRYVASFTVAGGLLVAGMWIQRRGERRISLGYQITACLALPVAVWLLFRETKWLAEPMIELLGPGGANGEIDREWLVVFGLAYSASDLFLTNRQTLAITCSWCFAALSLRWLAGSSAFTPFAALAGALALAAGWASAGLLEAEYDALARFGLYLFAVGSAAVLPGIWLNRQEEARVRIEGHLRMRRHDSWALLTVALIFVAIGLSLTAWNAGNVYTFGWLGAHDETTVRAVAFIINGVVLQALAHLFSRRRTIIRARLAEVIRWISPSHFLGGLLVLQIDADEGWWLFWLIVLAVAAIALCYLSAWRQWRPFLFTGLAYIAIAYFRAFVESYEALEDDTEAFDRVRVGLTIIVLVAGILTMLLAMSVPKWIGAVRLGRWSRRSDSGD